MYSGRWLIMLLYAPLLVKGHESLEPIRDTTIWDDDFPAMGKKMYLKEELGQTIRATLGIDRPVHKPRSWENVSPSLHLMGEDTGNKDFLHHRQLKHSFTELSALSDLQTKTDLMKTSCGAMKQGPNIFFHTCPGDLVVISIAGSMKMTCNEIEKRVFYGPVTLKNLDCQQSFVFDMECERKVAIGLRKSGCNDTLADTIIIALSALIVILIISLYAVARWFLGLRKGVKIGSGYGKLERVKCHYIFAYEEGIDENGDVKVSMPQSESGFNVVKKVYSIHWIKLLLLFALCIIPKVKSYELVEQYDTTKAKYAYQVVLDNEETVKFGPSMVHREVVVHTSQLTKMFSTAMWTLEHKEQYFCQWYKCEQYSVCGSELLPFIKLGQNAQTLFKFDKPERSFYTCQKTHGFCAFGAGCKLISFQINYDESDVYEVSLIGKGGSHGGKVSPPIGCVVEQVNDQSSGALASQILLHNPRSIDYLCPREVLSLKPELGMLGDLQILSNNNTKFASNEIRCVTDPSGKAICRYSHSTMKSIRSICIPVSELPFQLHIDSDSRIISWKLSGSATVTLKCDRPLSFTSNKTICSNVRIQVWDVAHLDAPTNLSFYGESTDNKANFKLPDMVHSKNKYFTCNGVAQFTELYDIKSLNSTGINFTHELVPYSGIDVLQEDHFSDNDPFESDSQSLNGLVYKLLPTGLTSIFLILGLALLVLFCLCKR